MNQSERENLHKFTVNKVFMVDEDTSIMEVYNLMQKEQIRHVPVVHGGRAIGIISDRDIRFVSFASDVTRYTAKDIMTENPYTVPANSDIGDVVRCMSQRKINSALIHDSSGKIVGIFTATDALNLLAIEMAS